MKTEEGFVKLNIESIERDATLGSILTSIGHREIQIPLSRLSLSARTVLGRVLFRANLDIDQIGNLLSLETLERITVQDLRDARNVGKARANEFISELSSHLTEINKPLPPCTNAPIVPATPVEDILDFDYLTPERVKKLFSQIRAGEQAHELLKSRNELEVPIKRRYKIAREVGKQSESILYASEQPLVVACAKYYSGKGVALADLISQGNRGLLMAMKKFDPESPHSFSTYATWWIRKAMVIILEENLGTASPGGQDSSHENLGNKNLVGDLLEQIVSLFTFLTPREINLFALRFGLIDGVPKSLDELALIYGEMHDRIRQIDSKLMSKIHVNLKGSPCPSCGEIKRAGSHGEIRQRIPAAIEITELIAQFGNYFEYIEKLVEEESDVILHPLQLGIILRLLQEVELAEKVEFTFSAWDAKQLPWSPQ